MEGPVQWLRGDRDVDNQDPQLRITRIPSCGTRGGGAVGRAAQRRAAARGRQRPRLERSGSSARGRRARASLRACERSQSAAGSQSGRTRGGGWQEHWGARQPVSLLGGRATRARATRTRGPGPGAKMPAIAVLAAAAAAWCFLQVESRHLDALAGGAGHNNGNFLDNDQWLSTVSQYERDKYWNRFRDAGVCSPGTPGRMPAQRLLTQSFQQMASPLCCGRCCQLSQRLPQVAGTVCF
nr:unnamed protein product [Rangifer tarandus platyrhynchus]